MSLQKVRVQLYDEDNNLVGDVDVVTSADCVTFADGETFQQKLNAGKLKGDKGETGPQGGVGAPGTAGAKGDAGARGSRWTSGTDITGNSTSATVFSGSGITDSLVNDMYLNTSTGYIYKCTEAGNSTVAKWVYVGSIKGATGAQGIKGDTGATGTTGAQGAKGETGATGATGTRGSRWTTGTAITGTSETATVYATGITDSLISDMYLNASTGYVYKCTVAGNASTAKWTYEGSIKGSTGAQGPKGEKGDPGDGIKVGSNYATAIQRKIFFKVVG